MKQESTIAVCLLAVGIAFVGWSSIKQTLQMPSGTKESDLTADGFKVARGNETATDFAQPAGRLAAFQTTLPMQIELGRPRPISDFRSDGSTRGKAEMLLRRAQHMIDDGPAFESDVNVRAKLFEQIVVGTGQYRQAGQGSGRTRTSLAFRTLPNDLADTVPGTSPEHEVLNLCDGRFVYRMHRDLNCSGPTLEFYDLLQLKQAKKKQNRSHDARNSIPLSPGKLMASGMAGLFQHLASEFRFSLREEDAELDAFGPTQVLVGTWKPHRLKELLRDYLSSEQIEAGLAWSHLPSNLPHATEVTLSKLAGWELFPSRIRFFQFQTHNNHTMAVPVVTIQFQIPRLLVSIARDEFVIRSQDLEATDLTQQYLVKLRPSKNTHVR